MRGDSLRDFYAKTLALTGLGALAVVGALVDSWPGAPSLAPVPTPAAGTALALLTANPVPDPAADETPARPRVRGQATRTVVLASYAGSPALDVESLALLSTDRGGDTATEVLSYQLEPHLAVVPAVQGAGVEVLLGDPTPTAAVVPEVVAMSEDPIATAEIDEARDGLITGAFKTAGSSIVKGGAKTGASVKAGFRMLSSAFRKALPG